MVVHQRTHWIKWSRRLLSKLKNYKKLNKHLAFENSLLLSQIRQLPPAFSTPLAALTLQFPGALPLPPPPTTTSPIVSHFDSASNKNNCLQPSVSFPLLCHKVSCNGNYRNNWPSNQLLSTLYESVSDYEDDDDSDDDDIALSKNLSAFFHQCLMHQPTCKPLICYELNDHEETPARTHQEDNTDTKRMVDADDHDTSTVLNDDPVLLPRKRRRYVDSYALPSLNSKLRKGDRISFTSPTTMTEAISRKHDDCPLPPPPPPSPPPTPPPLPPTPTKRRRHVVSYALPSLKSKLQAISRKRDDCPLPPPPTPPPVPSTPTKRKRNVASYTLPSLKSKLRKGDPMSFTL
ncbi:unnamed protein product [Absidia cylindrospora]